MSQPWTLLLAGALKSRRRSGGVTGARLGALSQPTKLTIQQTAFRKAKPGGFQVRRGEAFNGSPCSGIRRAL